MKLLQELQYAHLQYVTRRHWLRDNISGLGALWLSQLLGGSAQASLNRRPGPTHVPTAKRVIYLHMAGAPSQLEMFDHKPELARLDGEDCPQEYIEGQRFAFISGVPKVLGAQRKFHQAGQSGCWISDLLPHFERVVDDVCVIRSMQTDQINHAPAQLLLHTGNQNLGYPAIGSWVTYGLGTENDRLPGFIVLISGGRKPSAGKAAWGSGFLPGVYQGIQCRSKGDPVLYLANPEGITRNLRRRALDAINEINHRTYEELGDAETLTRIKQYELAFRMQTSAAEAFDLRDEPEHMLQSYGAKPGEESFANNCLLARRLAERGVRYIQLFDWGWDHHGTSKETSVTYGMPNKCAVVDRPMAALLADLKQRGLLEDTLVIWGGEFGRTPMRENRGGNEMAFKGRDHHKDAFTIWMAGGGVKAGFQYGQTDPLGFSVTENHVHIRDLQATILHLLGFEHDKLTYPFQGLDQRLTSVTRPCGVVREILA